MHKLLRHKRKGTSGGTRTAHKDCQAEVGNGTVISRVRCKSKTCSTCGSVWAGDFVQRMMRSCIAYRGDVGMLTVTAPGQHGANRLPFLPGTRTVLPDAAYRWNKSASKRWTQMHRIAAQRTRRKYGEFSLVAYVWEYQLRGMKHLHILLPGGSPRERAASRYYVAQLNGSGEKAALTDRFAFGNVMLGCKLGETVYEFVSSLRMQGYLAKYITKEGGRGNPEMLETALHPDAPARPYYVRSGLSPWTMEALRLNRRAYMMLTAHGCEGLAQHDADTPEKVEDIIRRLAALPPP